MSKVIGRTASGKDIYEFCESRYHADFTEQDHRDAVSVNNRLFLEHLRLSKNHFYTDGTGEIKFRSAAVLKRQKGLAEMHNNNWNYHLANCSTDI